MTETQKFNLGSFLGFVGALVAIFLAIGIAQSLGQRREALDATHAESNTIISKVTDLGEREISAFTLGRPEETDDSPCLGAGLVDLCALKAMGVGVCAANDLEMGTKLKIVSDGYPRFESECYVLDRMNSRYQNGEIDIGMLDYQTAKNLGREKMRVYKIDEYVIPNKQ